MINTRDIQNGNYFLDRGNKILRVDEIERWYDDNSVMTIKIGMENFIEVEHSLLAPDGKIRFHPYTEYQTFLKPILLSSFLKMEDEIFEGFRFKVSYVDDYIILLNGDEKGHVLTILRKDEEGTNTLIIYNDNSVLYVHQIQNIIYSITNHLLVLNEKLLLKNIENLNL